MLGTRRYKICRYQPLLGLYDDLLVIIIVIIMMIMMMMMIIIINLIDNNELKNRDIFLIFV